MSGGGVGRGVDLKDEDEVRDYLENLGKEYRFGCYHEKNPSACHLLADYMEAIKNDFARALRIYEINCDTYKHGHSCNKVGGYRIVGRACEKNADAAYSYFRKGCELGHNPACLKAGIMELTQIHDAARSQAPNPADGAKFLQKACDDGEIADACHRVSGLFISGVQNVVQRNMERAFNYALKGCDLGSMESCVNLSIMYRKGEGVARDESLAQKYADAAREIMHQSQAGRKQLKFAEGAE